ncbi:MAG TPA: mannosyltransferase, partial [Aequorivita sp.]|nr:mannosyltransferase [Aequorivita sp.]
MNFIKLYKIPLLFAILSIAFYISFAYDLQRSDFVKLLSLYSTLFFLAYLFIEKLKLNFWFLAALGIVFRLIFIVAIPNLSQDFYRFLWDGRLLINGV